MRRNAIMSLLLVALGVAVCHPSLAADHTLSPARAFSWTGFYVGVNAGYGQVQSKDEIIIDSSQVGSIDTKLKGFFGGAQIGANVQNGAFVFGAEADIQATGIKKRESTSGTCPAVICGVDTPFSITAESKVPYFATFRGRAGLANGQALFYVTGGAIYGKANADATLTVGVVTGTGSASTSSWGWTGGAGLEIAANQNTSWKIEYLYADFGDQSNVVAGNGTRGTTSAHLVRLGLNIRN